MFSLVCPLFVRYIMVWLSLVLKRPAVIIGRSICLYFDNKLHLLHAQKIVLKFGQFLIVALEQNKLMYLFTWQLYPHFPVWWERPMSRYCMFSLFSVQGKLKLLITFKIPRLILKLDCWLNYLDQGQKEGIPQPCLLQSWHWTGDVWFWKILCT